MEEPELVMYADAQQGEGPCWDEEQQRLYWIDMYQGKVHVYDPSTHRGTAYEVGQMIGAAVVKQSGGLLLALHNGFYSFDASTQRLESIADPEAHLPDNRFNDGKCDAAGRFWAGTMDNRFREGAGNLYVMEPDYSVRTAVTGVTISNGLAWSPDNRTMYYIDSPTQRVVAYDFDLETGLIRNMRTVIEVPKEEGLPDGMTSDSEGMLWIAYYFGGQVVRWNPHTGEKLAVIEMPVSNATSCVFGGPDLTELYITTSRNGLSEAEMREQPLAGGLFRVKTGIAGAPTYRFGR